MLCTLLLLQNPAGLPSQAPPLSETTGPSRATTYWLKSLAKRNCKNATSYPPSPNTTSNPAKIPTEKSTIISSSKFPLTDTIVTSVNPYSPHLNFIQD